MSEGIKRMLAERAKMKEDRAIADKGIVLCQQFADETLALVDKAAPFMDEGFEPNKWKPSEKLKIVYFVAATCPRPEATKEALLFIHEMLKRARELWTNGFIPDPWEENPFARRTVRNPDHG